jgi:hypothetical protein
MKKLFSTDYVLYDKESDKPIFFTNVNEIVIYGNKLEADEDCRGNEIVIPCTELPLHWQDKLLKQIK